MHDKYIEDTDSVTVIILVPKAKNMYDNLVKTGEWGKVDPRDTKLLALQTQFEKYKKANSNRNSDTKCPDATPTKKKSVTINPLRKIKKGDSMIIDGKQHWWCPHHKWEGEFDGLYMTHKPEDHHIWQKQKDERIAKFKKKKEEKKKSNGGGNTQNNNNKKSFTMSDKLKTALCTQGQLTPEQLDNIVESARDF